jgi:hypothetical protein
MKASTTRSGMVNKAVAVLALLMLMSGTSIRVEGFFQGIKLPSFPGTQQSTCGSGSVTKKKDVKVLEDRLLDAIETNSNQRLSNDEQIDALTQKLEQSGAGIRRPAIAPQIYGKWRLLHTTNAATSSPIQRKAVDASQYKIYQDVILNPADSNGNNQQLVVSQVVKFGESAELVVDALASTSAYPLKELTEPRQRDGKILGINILGVSKIGEEAAEDPNRPDSRIDFVFDEGNFKVGSVKVPYPVPFRFPLFRDAVKGWIDITVSILLCARVRRVNEGLNFYYVEATVDGIGLYLPYLTLQYVTSVLKTVPI